ncbi:DUF4126 domain-containing protein [Antrihabitans cavernicola]|uniref:DUF4126 domain-containing protein n=1 Tax=Antrihabitans cavernicola TaxID=2495913 RepID=A0A5A7SGG0_9NOCA|nr:DUF4126 domain-containing protein [Spelaeibacter cavernicola]KAA0023767.1 DUF4126 domain-containing protein [Spelaeibacter cavernicola]
MDTWVLPALLGLGLAAASGFRTFLPLLMLSIAAHFNLFGIDLSHSFAWVGSTGALVALAIAAVVELLADLIPFVDNALSLVGNVSGPVAGAIAAGSAFSSHDPTTAAIAGIIVGAPTALAFSTAQTGVRAASTATTAGVANPIVSVIEDVVTFLTSLIALIAPILIPIVLGAIGWVAWRGYQRFRRRTAAV